MSKNVHSLFQTIAGFYRITFQVLAKTLEGLSCLVIQVGVEIIMLKLKEMNNVEMQKMNSVAKTSEFKTEI
jgi:hypothetical protein